MEILIQQQNDRKLKNNPPRTFISPITPAAPSPEKQILMKNQHDSKTLQGTPDNNKGQEKIQLNTKIKFIKQTMETLSR